MEGQKKALVEYLLPENEQTVLQSAKDISVIDLSAGSHKKVVIPIVINGGLLREATLELLKNSTHGRYDLFKVQAEYQYHRFKEGVDFLVEHFLVNDRTLWSAHRFVEHPSGLNTAQQAAWARSPNIAQGDLNVNLEKKIYFGDGRDPLIARDGQAFMQVSGDRVLPIKTFFTPPEVAYIARLQKGK